MSSLVFFTPGLQFQASLSPSAADQVTCPPCMRVCRGYMKVVIKSQKIAERLHRDDGTGDRILVDHYLFQIPAQHFPGALTQIRQ